MLTASAFMVAHIIGYRWSCTFVMFMRHAKAVEAKPGERDEERGLAPEGIEEAVIVSRFMPKVKIVYSSSLRRAVETAEIVAQAHRVEYRVVDELAPGRYLKDVEPYFTDRAVFVGHSPYIEDWVSELTGFRPAMPTAAVVGVRRFGDMWFVELFITPRYAREVAERTRAARLTHGFSSADPKLAREVRQPAYRHNKTSDGPPGAGGV